MTDVPLHDLLARFGSAKRPERAPERERPSGVDDATVDALGLLSKALETAEDARGHLYSFHRLSGRADLDLQEAVTALREAGHSDVADVVDEILVGRDVAAGRWTFQLVESYDADYIEVFRTVERTVRARFEAPAHLAEAEMKLAEQSGRGSRPD